MLGLPCLLLALVLVVERHVPDTGPYGFRHGFDDAAHERLHVLRGALHLEDLQQADGLGGQPTEHVRHVHRHAIGRALGVLVDKALGRGGDPSEVILGLRDVDLALRHSFFSSALMLATNASMNAFIPPPGPSSWKVAVGSGPLGNAARYAFSASASHARQP